MSDKLTEIITSWKGELSFLGNNSTGGSVQMGTLDGKPGTSPMQLLLVALAGCTGMDIVSILQKKRVLLSDFQVKVTGKREPDFPMIWSHIHIIFLLWGNNIREKDVEQAIELSEQKYCSVGIMLGKSARISSEYHIYEPGSTILKSGEVE
jgi:putative redox protein